MSEAQNLYEKPIVVVIGSTGTGKSSLCNILCGIDPLDPNATFHVSDKVDGCTFDTTAHSCKWLGNGKKFTIIDTPGMDDPEGRDTEHIAKMVNKLKEIQFVNAFVIVFNGQNPRIERSLGAMLEIFQAMFGTSFWDNTVIEFSRWSYSRHDKKKRDRIHRNEESVQQEWSRKLCGKFGISRKVPAVFIDTHYDTDEYEEVKGFNTETAKLYEIISSLPDYECKDFQKVLAQMDQLKTEKAQAEAERDEAADKKEKAEAEKKKAEDERKLAETEKKKAEDERKLAEAGKKKAEDKRKLAEAEKKKAEDERKLAEAEKKKTEDEMKLAEAEKKTAEDGRKLAEIQRENEAIAVEENDMAKFEERISKLERNMEELQGIVSKEMVWHRRRNVIIFQLKVDNTNDNPEALKNDVINFIDNEIITSKEPWAKERIKNVFQIPTRFGHPPIIVGFRTVESVNFVISKCRNSARFNLECKRKGWRTVSVKRHYDAGTNRGIQRMNAIKAAMKVNYNYRNLDVFVKEGAPPRLSIQGKLYLLNDIPAKYAELTD